MIKNIISEKRTNADEINCIFSWQLEQTIKVNSSYFYKNIDLFVTATVTYSYFL